MDAATTTRNHTGAATTPLERRPQNWEALLALDDISVPSPSVSFGSVFLATLPSSGEIPIILDHGITLGYFSSPNQDYDLAGDMLPISSSIATAETGGTFGPPGRLQAPRSPTLSLNSQLSGDLESVDSSLVACGYQRTTRRSQLLTAQPDDGYYDKKSGIHSDFSLSAYMSPSASQLSLARSLPGYMRSSSSQSSWTSSSQETLNLRQNAAQRSPSLVGSLSTIILAAGSAPASPTITTTFHTEAQAYASRFRQNMTTSDSRSTIGSRVDFPLSGLSHDDRISLHSPVRTNFSRPSSAAPPLAMDEPSTVLREGPRLRTKSAATARSNDSGHSARTAGGKPTHSAQSSHRAQTVDGKPSKIVMPVPTLPTSLSWLENIRLQLWIDQEGFRLVQPIFHLSGYSYTPGDSGPDNAFLHGTLEFCPVEQQAYFFYHATLDPAPTLRKLTTQDDESRDYISRQATLAIKSNGVYSVSGSEVVGPAKPSSPTLPHMSVHHQDQLKLHWRFEYAVEDRLAGKTRPGEKALTPLSFSCTPGLLHPSNGKKIKLMQVFKKGLAPKLASAKIQDDHSLDFATGGGSHSATGHRRARSSAYKDLQAPAEIDRMRHQTEPAVKVSHPARKRSRAMSFSFGPQLTVDASLLDRHILPPALVQKMMNNPDIAIVDR